MPNPPVIHRFVVHAVTTNARNFVNIEEYANIVFLAFVGVCLVMMIYGTVFDNNWGINIRRVTCPECGMRMRRMLMPSSRKQAMWGGHTCPGLPVRDGQMGQADCCFEHVTSPGDGQLTSGPPSALC